MFSQPAIVLDPLGYRPGDQKIAFVPNYSSSKFEVRSKTKVMLKGKSSKIGIHDSNTGDNLFTLDFTNLTEPGLYHISILDSTVVSAEFQVKHDVYEEVFIKALQSFYFQRCGAEIDNGTEWKHPACHQKMATFFNDRSKGRNVRGGWHDAGDYNRFIATTALSCALLLILYEQNPTKFTDGQLHIPEKANGVPDILDEAKWALQWLVKMQNDDGGVFHKVSIKEWSGEHLPHEENDVQYLFDVSSTATGSSIATMAIGSRIFKKWDAGFSGQLLKSAVRSWKFLERQPNIVPSGGFRNPPDVIGGEYGDIHDSDERLWASVELYRLTGKQKYEDYFLKHYTQTDGADISPSWMNVAHFAFFSFLNSKTTNDRDRKALIARLVKYGNRLVDRVNSNGYRCVLTPEEFYWGSNSVVLGYAADLIQIYQVTGEPGYLNAALDQLHYILGRNTFGKTFFTGNDPLNVQKPYHQFSMLAHPGNPVPGMVVGGPNRNSKLNGKTLSEHPGKCYEDNEKNYFVNETAINYTAPLVFVAGYFCSMVPDTRKVASDGH